MNKFLKGNYEVEEKAEVNKAESAPEQGENFTAIFESKALDKLGGSIAFILKSNKFVWDEEDVDSE